MERRTQTLVGRRRLPLRRPRRGLPDPLPKKLNFGCGFDYREGYLNVDSDPKCSPDLLLVNNDLSLLPRESFDEVLANDVLEHIPRALTQAVILEWADLLNIGGTLKLETSDVAGIAERLAAEPEFADQYGWTQCMFGTQAHPGDFHHAGFTHRTLLVHLLAAGLSVDSIWTRDHWLINAQCTKTTSWTALIAETERLNVDEFVVRIFAEVLNRKPDKTGGTHLVGGLRSKRMTRRDALKHLMSSPERLFRTATTYGL